MSTDPSDVHARLVAAVQHRLDVARAATPGPWDYQAQSLHMDGSGTYRIWPPGKPQVLTSFMRGADPIHIAANDPATVIRHCERDLRVANRHRPREFPGMGALCEGCSITEGEAVLRFVDWWACEEITDALTAYAVEVDRG